MNQSFELHTPNREQKGTFDKITVVFGKVGFKTVHTRKNPDAKYISYIPYDKIVSVSDVCICDNPTQIYSCVIVNAYTLELPHCTSHVVLIGAQVDLVHKIISNEYQKICKSRDDMLGIGAVEDYSIYD